MFSKNNQIRDEKDVLFSKLMFWKKEFKKINKELENSNNNLDSIELEQRKIIIEKKLENAEKMMYSIAEGLYFGVAYELNNKTNPKPFPLIAKWKKLDNHVGFKGTTRVGKTLNMLGHIEQCIAKGMDVIVIDPKGGVKQEVLSSVAESCFKYKRAEEMSYFSPAFPSISEKINVCYGQSNIELSAMIVESIRTPNTESFYLEVSERILMSITTSFEYLQEVSDPTGEITRLLEQKEILKYHRYKNYFNFKEELDVDMIEQFKSNTEEEELLSEFYENGFNRSLITFRELEYYSHYKSLSALRILVQTIDIDDNTKYRKNVSHLRRDALMLLNSALATEEAHFSKVSDTLSNRLIQLSVGPIGELLCSTRINPLMNRLLRKDKGTVSVLQPFPMKFKRSAEVFNKMILGMLDSMMGAVGAEGRGLPRRVSIFIDEAGAIAYPGIERFFNKAGGLGITVFVYTQTDEDYKEALGETLATIVLDNVNTKGTMRLNTLSSSRDAAEEIGTFQQMKTVAMVTAGGDDSRFITDSVEKYLCTSQDIRSLSIGEGIMMHDGATYYMEFPFRRPPVASIKMPELTSETEKRSLANFEKLIEEESSS